MDGRGPNGGDSIPYGRGREVIALARSALSKVARRDGVAIGQTRADHVAAFCSALISPDRTAYIEVLEKIGATGIRQREIMDIYIPSAAEMLGTGWTDDHLSFAEVSIGSSRLNEIILSIATTHFDARGQSIPLGHCALMIVPAEEQHSIGAFIAANQFRKHGVRVHMSIGHSPEEIAALLENERFCMIGISAGSEKLIDPVQKLVELVRKWNVELGPIVLGGAVTGLKTDVVDATGVDLLSSNAREVLDFCGFRSQLGQTVKNEIESPDVDLGPEF